MNYIGSNDFLTTLWNLDGNLESHQGMISQTNQAMSQFSKKAQSSFLHRVVIESKIKHYHLFPSTWTPSQPFEKLIDIVKRNGPMALAGK